MMERLRKILAKIKKKDDEEEEGLYACRVVMVSSVKWVDEVITDAPYAINEEFMNKLFVEHKIDYIIHGDDPCLLPDGSDAYALAKKAGRYKQIKRTEGVSSTDIVGMLLAFLFSL
jgi:ethanolamine-phosphate cytidylyltransferase